MAYHNEKLRLALNKFIILLSLVQYGPIAVNEHPVSPVKCAPEFSDELLQARANTELTRNTLILSTQVLGLDPHSKRQGPSLLISWLNRITVRNYSIVSLPDANLPPAIDIIKGELLPYNQVITKEPETQKNLARLFIQFAPCIAKNKELQQLVRSLVGEHNMATIFPDFYGLLSAAKRFS